MTLALPKHPHCTARWQQVCDHAGCGVRRICIWLRYSSLLPPLAAKLTHQVNNASIDRPTFHLILLRPLKSPLKISSQVLVPSISMRTCRIGMDKWKDFTDIINKSLERRKTYRHQGWHFKSYSIPQRLGAQLTPNAPFLQNYRLLSSLVSVKSQ